MRYIRFLKDTEVKELANSEKIALVRSNNAENKSKEEKNHKKIYVYNSYMKNSLRYDRELLLIRLKNLLNQDKLPGLDENYDENISKYVNIIENVEDPIIKGDISYDVAVSDFFYFILF